MSFCDRAGNLIGQYDEDLYNKREVSLPPSQKVCITSDENQKMITEVKYKSPYACAMLILIYRSA